MALLTEFEWRARLELALAEDEEPEL